MYSKRIMEYFKNPRFSGKLKKFNGYGKKGNPVCGDILKFYIFVKDNKIKDISYTCFGCVAAISSSEALCRLVKDKTLERAEKISDKDIIKHLGGKMPAEKIHCSVLGADALREAIKDYKRKH